MTAGGISFRGRVRTALVRWPARPSHTGAQLLRFLIIGSQSNIVYYALYVALTAIGTGPKLSATLVFVVGILYSFILNKSLVFKCSCTPRAAFFRYTLVYISAWAFNMLCLELFVSQFSFSHHIVQAALVPTIGAGIFAALKLFVFRARKPSGGLHP